MNAYAITVLLIVVVVVVGTMVLNAVRRVRFSLRVLLAMVLSGGTCVSLIISAPDPALKTLGIFGAIVWIAVLISVVARANIPEIHKTSGSQPREQTQEGEPPHGPESDR